MLYTPQGYGIKERSPMHDVTKAEVTRRLRRIEGQIGGLLRMVEDDRYCVDVLTQINAVRAALHKVEEKVLGDHVSHCVAAAFAIGRRDGSAAQGRGADHHHRTDDALSGHASTGKGRRTLRPPTSGQPPWLPASDPARRPPTLLPPTRWPPNSRSAVTPPAVGSSRPKRARTARHARRPVRT